LALAGPVVLLLLLRQSPTNTSQLAITLLDVGQGESIHIRYPSGDNALIDTGGLSYPPGGNFVGERLVSRYLWQLRIRKLSFVLITHPDNDHKKGYSFIKLAFPIGQLFFAENQNDYQEPKHRLIAGDTFSIGEVKHCVLHPSEKHLESLKGNAASLVMCLDYKAFSILFTGDIENEVEASLIPQLRNVTALKVAHHGSNSSTSSNFLSVVRPKIAIISAGRGHYFGHPSPKVEGRIRAAGAKVFSTKKLGSLRILTNGHSWELQHYSIEKARFETLSGPESIEEPIHSEAD
jgi:competence protein ComEC